MTIEVITVPLPEFSESSTYQDTIT